MPPPTRLADYWSLTKPDVNLLIGITTAAGFCLGRPLHGDGFPFLRLAQTVVGTLLVDTVLYDGRRDPWCVATTDRMGRSYGSLSLEAWMLYALLFLWQFPHFMAIAWMYRADYNRAGYAVLPTGELGALFMVWQVGVPMILLVPVSVTPVVFGQAGPVYLATAVMLGALFMYPADRLAVQRSNAMARRLLFASIVYLPVIFSLLVLDRL